MEIIDDNISETTFSYIQEEKWIEMKRIFLNQEYEETQQKLLTCADEQEEKKLKSYLSDLYWDIRFCK